MPSIGPTELLIIFCLCGVPLIVIVGLVVYSKRKSEEKIEEL